MVEIVETVVKAQARLGEGSFWDSERQVLYWVDIEGKRLFIYDPASGENQAFDFGEKIGTVVPRKGGGLLLAFEHSLTEFDPSTGAMRKVASFEAEIPENRANEGKCDPAGRLWVGSMAPDEKPGGAGLYRVEPDYTIRRVLTGVTISNGIVWSHDRMRMYYIDTPARTVFAFDYDLDTGEIQNRRVCIEVPASMGFPDGMTIDEAGLLWIALFGGRGVSRWNPADGRMVEYIEMPAKNITSCAFGGKNLDELYVTSARILLSEKELQSQPEAGNLFRVKTECRGVPMFVFAG